MRYEEDLYPGDCCCESALDGAKTRFLTILTITPCDMAVVEYSHYYTALDRNEQKESIDDKVQFLTRTPTFRHWDGVDLYRVANAMVREELPKSTVIISKGDISKKLCLLMEGRIDIVIGLNPHQMQHIITTINQYECFNESGILTYMSFLQSTNNGSTINNHNHHNNHNNGHNHDHNNHNNTNNNNNNNHHNNNNHNHHTGNHFENFVETCYAISGSNVVILSLPESNYHILDQSTIDKLSISYREKNTWRLNRMLNLRTESKNIKKWKKQLKLFGDDQNIATSSTSTSTTPNSFQTTKSLLPDFFHFSFFLIFISSFLFLNCCLYFKVMKLLFILQEIV